MMKWYTMKWGHNQAGSIVEHFVKKSDALKRKAELKDEPGFESFSYIEKYNAKNSQELVNWLNAEFTTDNG